jgi:hypothetical protein
MIDDDDDDEGGGIGGRELVGETEVLRENSPLVPLRPPQIPL